MKREKIAFTYLILLAVLNFICFLYNLTGIIIGVEGVFVYVSLGILHFLLGIVHIIWIDKYTKRI